MGGRRPVLGGTSREGPHGRRRPAMRSCPLARPAVTGTAVREKFRQGLYCVLTDGSMTYPVFVEVAKKRGALDLEDVRRAVSARYGIPLEELRVLSHPRWATRVETPGGHVLHIGMIPGNVAPE